MKVSFQISELLLLPEAAGKAIFYDMRNLGEIGFQNFDFSSRSGDQKPTIKLHKVRGSVGKLMQV